MKKLIILAVLVGGGYYLYANTGLLNSEPSEVVKRYKRFMDRYIVRDYERALAFTADSAKRKVERDLEKVEMEFAGRKIDTPLAEKGVLEGSRINVLEEREEGNDVLLRVQYNASISWPGRSANRMSPKSWRRWEQTAEMESISGEWKVTRFSSTSLNN